MQNRDVYLKNPEMNKLANEGVASVNDQKTEQELSVLRYELETFVCDGQYEKGMRLILETYLKNLSQAQQPGVWVSGFFGSGKSHLVKMLRALWVDEELPGGARARSIADLPDNIKDLLKELSSEAKRHGGLHAASGTLGAGAEGSVRLALLRVIFKSVGLPGQYHLARFVMWLKKTGIYDAVKAKVEANGDDWDEELDNLHVAEGLHEVLIQVKSNIFSSTQICAETLNNQYPIVQDVSNDEMIKAIKDSLGRDGQMPLILVVLDEVQQYIDQDGLRASAVQEVVESCTKNIGSKLLFVGTGQTAITGTSQLKKLEGRFTLRIELGDTDVNSVIRKVVLAKTPEAKAPITAVMEKNLGEISRHLSGTTLEHTQNDLECFAQDYPLLPVRRRFWDSTLRVLDLTGTDSQLRNQLKVVHKVIQTNLDAPLGHVVPADFLYFDSADSLLQACVLPRKVHEKTMSWREGTGEEQLLARACGMVFLINKLAGHNEEIGIEANIDTIADFLVEDLTTGSSALRSRLPAMLDGCDLLSKVKDTYIIQTDEGAAWNDDFQSQQLQILSESHRIEAERDDRIRKKFGSLIQGLTLTQGASKVPRTIHSILDADLPSDAKSKICLWVRHGWNSDESSVQVDARQAGNEDPTIFLYIPKRSSDEIRSHIVRYKAAMATLANRSVTNTPEGRDARVSMETIRAAEESRLDDLIDEAFSGAKVFQAGGTEISGSRLKDMVLEAASHSLRRLYPDFVTADHAGWAQVYTKAKSGVLDALKAVGDDGEVIKNPICKTILGFIAAGKTGEAIRQRFEAPPYGWSRDAVDGGIQILLVAGLLRGDGVTSPTELERKNIGKTQFHAESVTITTQQRIAIRQLYQKAQIPVTPGQEQASAGDYIQALLDLASDAGGDAPKPIPPDTEHILEIRRASGNEQLMQIYSQSNALNQNLEDWKALSDKIRLRLPKWNTLKVLAGHLDDHPDTPTIQSQVQTIEEKRHLIDEPDPIQPMMAAVSQLLRDELNRLKKAWDMGWQRGEAQLEADENWQKIDPDQRFDLRVSNQLREINRPDFNVESTESILATLESTRLSAIKDRIAALPNRYSQMAFQAAKLLEPQTQEVELPSTTLKTEDDIDQWVATVSELLKDRLRNGPVIPS